jgi:5-methylcytosine-specific restriction endonuclease McrA
VEIRFTVSREEAALLEKLLDRQAHKNFERRYEKLFMDMARNEIRKLEKNQPQDAAPQRPEKMISPKRSRYIPAQIRRVVWNRDQGICQYFDSITQRKCAAKHGVQIDHIQSFVSGGSHNPENLRLLCGAHNRWRQHEKS